MFTLVILGVISFLLVLVLKFLSMLMAERVVLSREELSSYECGFEHHNVSRLPISLRYFFLTLLFLLFDLELVFLLFLPHYCLAHHPSLSLLISSLFISFLLLSLLYE
jgi:NADH-ubiquinone oxidoreductase chain 3